MEIVKIKTSKIKLNEENPRTIKDSNFQNLIKSVKEFPEMLEIRPIVVDENMIVLGGNMRFRACLEAGMKEVPVIVVNNLTDEQKREFIIKDNVSGGDWDWDVLVNSWDVDQLKDWGLEPPNFKNSDDDDEKEAKFLDQSYYLNVQVENEEEQQKLYEELISRGLFVKII